MQYYSLAAVAEALMTPFIKSNAADGTTGTSAAGLLLPGLSFVSLKCFFGDMTLLKQSLNNAILTSR